MQNTAKARFFEVINLVIFTFNIIADYAGIRNLKMCVRNETMKMVDFHEMWLF